MFVCIYIYTYIYIYIYIYISIYILQVSEHLPQVVDVYIYIHMYTYLDWFPVDRLPVDWLPMEPPMDAVRLPVGMVAFGSVDCGFLRNS